MSEKERLHTSVLVAPATERRRLRAQRRQAAARLQAEQRRREVAEAKAKAEVERAERKATRYLPAAGEPGKQTLRTPGRFRLPRHQDTSATLSAQYPFLAEGGLGYSCIAEIRMIETINDGAPRTPFMGNGDTVRIDMKDASGHSIFGAIDQTVELG